VVRCESAKNAILPVLAASLLTGEEVVLHEVPPIQDVITMLSLLERLGASVRREGDSVRLRAGRVLGWEAPYDLMRQMRASFLVVGPLLARFGRARASLPGGCAIGQRPVDLHLKGFRALGAEVEIRHGYLELRAERLRGTRIYLDYPSHTSTENIMMAACLAEGTTFIENAALDPEVVDLASFLNAMGGRVFGAGTQIIRVDGVRELRGCSHTCIPDRLEAGTYAIAAAITGGEVTVENVVPEHLKPVLAKLAEAGAEVEVHPGAIRVRGRGRPRAANVKTWPYPGFPTDLQAPIMSLLSLAEGTSVITETVFENRFLHVEELRRMGADISLQGPSAIVRGVEGLTGAPVWATDLRAGAALVLAGLAARGVTEVFEVRHLDRGYHDLVGKLSRLGADIRRVEEEVDLGDRA